MPPVLNSIAALITPAPGVGAFAPAAPGFAALLDALGAGDGAQPGSTLPQGAASAGAATPSGLGPLPGGLTPSAATAASATGLAEPSPAQGLDASLISISATQGRGPGQPAGELAAAAATPAIPPDGAQPNTPLTAQLATTPSAHPGVGPGATAAPAVRIDPIAATARAPLSPASSVGAPEPKGVPASKEAKGGTLPKDPVADEAASSEGALQPSAYTDPLFAAALSPAAAQAAPAATTAAPTSASADPPPSAGSSPPPNALGTLRAEGPAAARRPLVSDTTGLQPGPKTSTAQTRPSSSFAGEPASDEASPGAAAPVSTTAQGGAAAAGPGAAPATQPGAAPPPARSGAIPPSAGGAGATPTSIDRPTSQAALGSEAGPPRAAQPISEAATRSGATVPPPASAAQASSAAQSSAPTQASTPPGDALALSRSFGGADAQAAVAQPSTAASLTAPALAAAAQGQGQAQATAPLAGERFAANRATTRAVSRIGPVQGAVPTGSLTSETPRATPAGAAAAAAPASALPNPAVTANADVLAAAAIDPDEGSAEPLATAPEETAAFPGQPALRDATGAALAGAAPAADPRPTAATVHSLAAELVRRLDQRITRFEVALNPAGLGRVDVSLQIGAQGQLSAALACDRSQSAAELRGRAHELEGALREAGFDVQPGALSFTQLDAGLSGDGGRRTPQQFNDDQPQQRSAPGARAFGAAAERADPTIPRFNRSSSGLDIQV